jgi:ferrous iron transport protein B
VKKAGSVILASSILIWAITTFPVYKPALGGDVLSAQEAGLEHSAAGRIGQFIEPAFRPLGFDWKIGVATVTGFAAKEVIVSTLGILYRVGDGETEKSASLRGALRADPTFTPLVAFVLMLFILVIPPCFAALATIKAELGWAWLGFSVAFMLALGWGLGATVYQVGSLLGAAAVGTASPPS